MPSWGGHPLLGGHGLHLMEARSSRSLWLSQSPTTPTDTGSGQQVLRSGGQKRVHWYRVNWRQSWWWVSQWRYPAHRGAGRGLCGRGHGHIGHRQGHPQCRSLTGSLVRYIGAPTLFADSEAEATVFHRVILSNQFKTPTMSSWGQLTAAFGGILMPEATSWTCVAHWVKLDPGRSTVVNPAKEGIPGAGGGTTIREHTRRALFSRSLRTEASNGASKRVTYHLTPRVSVRACGKSLHVGSLSDPNMMYSSLQ